MTTSKRRWPSPALALPVLMAVMMALLMAAQAAQAALDLASMWDFNDPALSERRFRAALATAQGDDALILQTQIARSHGLRRDFAQARSLLLALQPQLAGAGPEARVRHALELGRTYVSAAHAPAERTPEAVARARAAYEDALRTARAAGLDGLAIDAIHMFAFVDPAPADQLTWNRQALALVLASPQPAAKRWEASVRNNLGMALHGLGRYDEALQEFQQALALRERGGNAQAVREARWSVAWTLRALKRQAQALEIQLQLERECAAAGAPDPDVFEELEALYREQGNEERARHYAALRQASQK